MPKIKNVIEKANSMTGKINPLYDLNVANIEELYDKCEDPFSLICCSFKFGYMQGMKAAKAELRKAVE